MYSQCIYKIIFYIFFKQKIMIYILTFILIIISIRIFLSILPLLLYQTTRVLFAIPFHICMIPSLLNHVLFVMVRGIWILLSLLIRMGLVQLRNVQHLLITSTILIHGSCQLLMSVIYWRRNVLFVKNNNNKSEHTSYQTSSISSTSF